MTRKCLSFFELLSNCNVCACFLDRSGGAGKRVLITFSTAWQAVCGMVMMKKQGKRACITMDRDLWLR